MILSWYRHNYSKFQSSMTPKVYKKKKKDNKDDLNVLLLNLKMGINILLFHIEKL